MMFLVVAFASRQYALGHVADIAAPTGSDGRMRASTAMGVAVIGLIGAAAVLSDTWLWLLMAVSGLLFVIFAIAHPRPALLVWLLAAPVANAYATVSIPGAPDIMFGRVTVVVVGAALLLRVILKGRPITAFGAIDVAMAILLTVMFVNLVRSDNRTSDFMQDFDERATPILLFVAARNLCIRRIDLRNAAYVIAVVGCYLALHGGYQYWVYNGAPAAGDSLTLHEGGQRVNESHLEEGRAVGPFTSAVEYGGVTAMCLLGVLYLTLSRTRGLRRLLLVAAVPLIAAAVIMSSTRSAWVGGLVAVLTLLALDRRRRLLLPLAVAAAAAVLAVSMFAIPKDSALEARAESLEPIRARLLMYDVGIRIAVRRPFLGYGRGAPSRVAARKELADRGDPDADLAAGQFHNVFLMTVVEWGIVALLAYVAILVLIVKAALRLRRRLPDERDPAHQFAGLVLAMAIVYVTQGLLVDIPPFLYLNGVFFFFAGVMFAQLDATAPILIHHSAQSYEKTINLAPVSGAAEA
jgi:O-antigen ligase